MKPDSATTCGDELFSVTDGVGDRLDVETSCGNCGEELYIRTDRAGVMLSVSQIKKLRKVLKEWLIVNGHKKEAA